MYSQTLEYGDIAGNKISFATWCVDNSNTFTNILQRIAFSESCLEIPCRVSVSMPETVKITEILKKYKEMTDVMYVGPEDLVVVGSFTHHTIDVSEMNKKRVNKSIFRETTKEAENNSLKKPKKTQAKDVREYFSKKNFKEHIRVAIQSWRVSAS